MRTPALLLIAALALAGAARAQTAQDDSKVDVKGAAKAPLEDLNVVRTDIPAALLKAEADVYARPSPRNCTAIRTQVAALDEALGDDFDAPPLDETDAKKAKRTATANGALKDTASSVIPFHGWVRRLSGAAQHQQMVERAIAAGRVRRGYLKGLGQSMGSAAPVDRLLLVNGITPPAEDGQASPSP
jgi:hypothetical protein